jgi:hypothetical protein
MARLEAAEPVAGVDDATNPDGRTHRLVGRTQCAVDHDDDSAAGQDRSEGDATTDGSPHP